MQYAMSSHRAGRALEAASIRNHNGRRMEVIECSLNGAIPSQNPLSRRTRSQTAKLSRKITDLSNDILKYEELKEREKDLAADIPPNRRQRHCEAGLVKTELEADPMLSSGLSPPTQAAAPRKRPRKTKERRRVLPAETSARIDHFKEMTQFFTRIKPKFRYPVKTQQTPAATETRDRIAPPRLLDSRLQKLFEDRVILTNLYLQLIKAMKEGLTNDSIDVALQHSFAPKNLHYEEQRFDVGACDSAFTPAAHDAFLFDLDVFIQRLGQDVLMAKSIPLA